jgi:hypothetical protein
MIRSALRALPAAAGARGMLIAATLTTACATQVDDAQKPDLATLTQAAQGGNGGGNGSGNGNGDGNGGGNGNGNGDGNGGGNQPVDLDVRRSLVVTEQPILERFGFERVLNQLVAQSGVPGLTAIELFLQWWDTNNPSGEGSLGLGPNCDTANINEYPFTCRPDPGEGKQTQCTSLADPNCAYIPIGLFNRFDLAPVDGSHCGEHRIVFAKASGLANSRERNLIIFEAAMPNPLPNQGIKGCRKIVEAWADLTKIDDLETRADKLEAFYFEGHGNVPPVVHVEHYGDNALGAGQIRANQFMSPSGSGIPWSLREFKLKKVGCPGPDCTMQVLPVTVKNNPYGPLFAGEASESYPLYFAANAVASLAAANLSDIGMSTPDEFNAAQSNSSGGTENNYPANFAENASFATAIQAAIPEGTVLTPEDIVARAGTQSCAGCHQLSNDAPLGNGLRWPKSLGFVHVSERVTEVVDGVTRYGISEALTDAFLPVRKEVMEGYLAEQPGRYRGTGRTIGGSETH